MTGVTDRGADLCAPSVTYRLASMLRVRKLLALFSALPCPLRSRAAGYAFYFWGTFPGRVRA